MTHDAALPSGSVTFLFTDIVGSTRRWEEDPEMSAALAEHDAIVRRAVETGGGRVLKHTGDGAFAVFSAAQDAVGAAVEAQRRLGETSSLAVRIAVHTGEADERDGDYFGPAPNRAARLMAVAHGGQVLASSAAEAAVRGRLPPGVGLVDLGEQRLRDLDRPERVFQVTAEGLASRFPPLRSAAEAPSNLPESRTSFVGRADDLARVGGSLEAHRLVTLVGVGGAGKTRLAVETGHRVRERYPGGVYFVDLSSLTDGAAIGDRLAEVLGQPGSGRAGTGPAAGTGPLDDAVVAFLTGRPVLVVLDNCEHLLDAGAGFVDHLLAAAPDVVVLATSREALGVDGEQIWPVRSLSLPDGEVPRDSEALALLVDRIAAVRPGVAFSAEDDRALAEICVRLDGIPLALELAAARAAHLAPRDIADRLTDRFTLLAGGRRRTERHQTLQATIDWSYDLLDADEQAVLRRMAVFAGGFTLDAAEGICLEGVDALGIDVIGSLVDKSLVVAGHEGRYRLLETIRLYAEGKLVAAGEAEHVRSRHRDWFLACLEAEPLDRCLVSDSFALEVRTDADDLHAALAWCDVEDRPDLLRRLLLRIPTTVGWLGRRGEGSRAGDLSDWAERALAYERTLPAAERHCHVRAAAPWPSSGGFAGDTTEVAAAIDVLHDLTDHLRDGETITAYAHLQLADLLTVFPTRVAEVDGAANRAIAHAGTDAPRIAARALWIKANASLFQYRYDEAAALLERLQSARDRDHSSSLGIVRHLQGRHREALELIDAERPRANEAWQRSARIAAAVVTAALGDLRGARTELESLVAGIRSARGPTHPLASTDLLVGFAALAALEGEYERASRLVAAVTVPSLPGLFVLLRHYRDLARDHLDRDVRRRCIDEGRAMTVDDAIDTELAR